MATPNKAPWMATLEKHTPELSKAVKGLEEMVQVDSALPAKTKILMMMLCDALVAHSDGVAALAGQARAAGASDAEIAETLEVALLMGGLPGIVTGVNAFRD
jgi:alkylhydroperoxidase/carboxymuconolactone decarboxylase family protein YurZ